MTQEQVIRFETALLEFVERAAGLGACAAEIAALPAVAQVLADKFI